MMNVLYTQSRLKFANGIYLPISKNFLRIKTATRIEFSYQKTGIKGISCYQSIEIDTILNLYIDVTEVKL